MGQDRQAEDRRRRHALSQADGDRGRRDSRSGHQVHGQVQEGRQAVLRLAESDADAHRHAFVSEMGSHPQRGEWLVGTGSRHGPTRQRHRPGPAKAQGHGRGGQHHRGVHHRQRHGKLHLARRRHDAVRAVQRDRHGRRLPRPLHPPLARQGARGRGAEWADVRPGLVSHLPGCRGSIRRSPNNCSRA